MTNEIKMVADWHAAFGVPVSSSISALTDKRFKLRERIMKEELSELLYAMEYGIPEQWAKELCDLLYVVLGTAVELGIQNYIPQVFAAVHESNMSKLDNDGKPVVRHDGKILKGPNYKEPNIEFIY